MLWRGAYHVHTTLSDGSGTPETIAAAAAAADLDFVILTDHGDATREPAPPRMIEGVLLIDAVEISTDDGHYVALGLPRAPYPLGGEGRAVAEDVRRLGGLGLLAHPDSPRPALAWHDPSVDADGYEWINADSTWRSAGTPQLIARVLAYPFNRAGTLVALARYPGTLFAERDQPPRAPQLALAAVDAHARIGWQPASDPIEGGRTLVEFPSYRASFGTFGVVVPWLEGAPSGDAARDAAFVLRAIRQRQAGSAVFSMAAPAWLSLGTVEAVMAGSGPDAQGEARLEITSNGPAGATIRVMRNGRVYREFPAPDASLPLRAGEAGAVYRAELWLPARRGWPAIPLAVSPARGHNLPDEAPPRAGSLVPGPGYRVPGSAGSAANGEVDIHRWHVEHDPRSGGMVQRDPGGARAVATLRLAAGNRVSQFAALVGDLAPAPTWASGLELELSSATPMRLSVQWREPRPGEGLRWRHSTYVDATPRVVELPLADFRPIRPATGRVPLDRVHALLLVTDTVNARPGDSQTVTVHAARWMRGR